jgi:hypothetical protein
VYDNLPGASDTTRPTSVIGGGSITIHKSKDGTSSLSVGSSIPQDVVDKIAVALPTEYALYNAYPNPFNPSTTIKFDLPEAANVRLVVFDMLGREVAVLANGEHPAGQYSVRIYIYRLQSGHYVQTKKLMLMK